MALLEVADLEVTRYDVAERVATITLHRPERLNAWTARMNAEYRSCLQRASTDPGVRVIVVTGSGRGFCAGAESEDLAGHVERGAYRSWDTEDLDRPGYGVRPEFDAELAYHFGVPKPVIASVNGPAAGIGFALACYCDLRFAAAGARFTTAHGRLGLPCAFGLAWLLPKLIGLPRAMDLILSSRTFSAEEALVLGLVTAVVPADQLADRVLGYARELATSVSPASMAASKLQVYEAFHSSAAEAVRAAEALIDPMMSGPDYPEGVAALRQKRPAVFADLPVGDGHPPPTSPTMAKRLGMSGPALDATAADRSLDDESSR
jgi:enoyl-CoA hydratase/carnithine racemase